MPAKSPNGKPTPHRVHKWLKQLGLETPMPEADFWAKVAKDVGTAQGQALRTTLSEGGIPGSDEFKAMYEEANLNMAIARALFPKGSPHANTWLAYWDKAKLPAGDLLDLGCGPGFLTCYYASVRPNVRVVGVDQSANAVARGRELAESLGLANVEFVQADITEGLPEIGTFTVVVSTGTVSEIERTQVPTPLGSFSDIPRIAEMVATPPDSAVATAIAQVLAPDGVAIACERLPHSTMQAWWLAALSGAGLNPNLAAIDTLVFQSQRSTGEMRFPVIRAGRHWQPLALDPLLESLMRVELINTGGGSPLREEMRLKELAPLQMYLGWECLIRDQFGPGATRLYLFETATGHWVHYETTSRGARKVVSMANPDDAGRVSAERLYRQRLDAFATHKGTIRMRPLRDEEVPFPEVAAEA